MLVIFAFMLTILIGMAAFVVDMAWIWSHQLQAQRAADAGALAGVVYLPGDIPSARNTARDESQKNGFEHNVGGVDVEADQDTNNDRQMVVTVTAPVNTFFMRVFGFDQVTVSRTARAEFVLPVPMGSPQNYYGVGEYQGFLTTSTAGDTDFRFTDGTVSGGEWSDASRAVSVNGSYTTEASHNDFQAWDEFGLLDGPDGIPNDSGLVIEGIEVRLRGVSLAGSGSPTSECRILAALSSGGAFTSSKAQNITSTTLDDFTLGSASDTWGRSWTRSQLSDSNFRVRLTWQEPSGCNSSRSVRLDGLEVRVTYRVVSATQQILPVVAPDGTTLVPQNFWGAGMTIGSQRTYGDQHGPAWDGGSNPNADHDPDGHSYDVEVGAGGEVWIFDAGFCETASNGTGGWFGAGDHWIGSDRNAVTTEFRLYDTNGTPYNKSDDALIPLDSGFPNLSSQKLTDRSGDMGTPRAVSGAGDCSQSPHDVWHNEWVPLARNIPAGDYRVNVTLANAANSATNAENGWSIWVTGGAEPRVYGAGRMVAYNNLRAGVTDFYLAQIDQVHAGKTLEMDLFDPDASSNGTLSILSPDGGSYNLATFSYDADGNCTGASDACSAANRQSIRVVNGGAQGFNNSVVTITIPLPTSYGSGGLAEDGWWKIRYDVDGGNDTTTWKVTIRGNPVHLVVP